MWHVLPRQHDRHLLVWETTKHLGTDSFHIALITWDDREKGLRTHEWGDNGRLRRVLSYRPGVPHREPSYELVVHDRPFYVCRCIFASERGDEEYEREVCVYEAVVDRERHSAFNSVLSALRELPSLHDELKDNQEQIAKASKKARLDEKSHWRRINRDRIGLDEK